MISGMRKLPPISISSPRETIASRPSASVLSASTSAAAQLLTTSASSAPVSSRKQRRAVRRSAIRARRASTSYSRFENPRATRAIASIATCGERRAAEIRVQHDAGGVDHASQRRARRDARRRRDGARPARARSAARDSGAARAASIVRGSRRRRRARGACSSSGSNARRSRAARSRSAATRRASVIRSIESAAGRRRARRIRRWTATRRVGRDFVRRVFRATELRAP